MNNQQLSQALKKLLPEMATKSATEVLLKYATTNKLVPDQLRRLAELSNVSQSIATVKSASPEQRGRAVPLIDVQALLGQYTDPTIKSAARLFAPTGGQYGVKDLFAPAPTVAWLPTEKAASAVVAPTSQPQCAADLTKEAHVRDINLQTLDTLRHDAQKAIHQGLLKLAKLLRTFPKEAALMGQAIHLLAPECANKVQTGVRAILPSASFDKSASLTFYNDPHGIEPILRTLQDSYTDLTAINATEQAIKQAFDMLMDDPSVAGEQEVHSNAISTFLRPPEAKKKPTIDVGGTAEPKDTVERSLPQHESHRELAPPVGDGKEGPLMSALRGSAHSGRNLVDTAGKGIQQVSQYSPNTDAENVGKGYMTLFAPDHGKQVGKLQRRMMELRQATTLQRLMITDDVISKHDPARVRDAFESIRRLNPELAADKDSVRVVLREALQYQGVPLQTQKTLKDVAGKPGNQESTESSTPRKNP